MTNYIQKLVSFFTSFFKAFSLQRQRDKSLKGTEAHLRAVKRIKGNSARLEAHRRSCLQAYEQKRNLVKDDKGLNTLSGIPASA